MTASTRRTRRSAWWLSDPVAAGLEQAVGTATIIDDDDAATLVVSGASVFEHQGEAVVSVSPDLGE